MLNNDLARDEELAKLSTDELIDLGIQILEDIRLRLMEAAGELTNNDINGA